MCKLLTSACSSCSDQPVVVAFLSGAIADLQPRSPPFMLGTASVSAVGWPTQAESIAATGSRWAHHGDYMVLHAEEQQSALSAK